jgi:gluconate 5-dehydrogenase
LKLLIEEWYRRIKMPAIQELFNLKDKVAIITGGAGHLGTAISEALAEAGANVVIASRNIDNCKALAKKLSQNHPKTIGLKLDINSEESIFKLVEEVTSKFGRLDILFNNAISGKSRKEHAISGKSRKELEQMSVEEFESMLHGGLTSYFCMIKACVPHMKKIGKGSIVNIASMYGIIAPHFKIYRDRSDIFSPVNYHACKGGVIQMTRYMASYFAKDNIRVNAISPGSFSNPQIIQKYPWFEEELSHQNPMNRIGKPWELKGAALFLASDASSYITGHNLVVDGGWTVW